MNILINIAVFDTDQNKRTAYTIETYKSLMQTVNFDTTEIVFIDNASCAKTKKFLKSVVSNKVHVITNDTNVGTAEAINKGIHTYSKSDTYNIKCDNDITFGSYGWADEMVRCIETDKSIGILGLKRKDLPNQPSSKEYPTIIDFIPEHKLGEVWFKDRIMVEWCDDIIGSCTMFNPLLLDKIGYSWQPALYGFEDTLLGVRSIIAGFRNAFLPLIEIEHIDIKASSFTEWKRKQAGLYWDQFEKAKEQYISGERDIYYNPFE